jgi:type IV pilus assembly protein PilQ
VDWAATGGIQNSDPNAGIGPQRGMHAWGGTRGWNTAMNFPVADGGQIGFNFARIAGTPFVLNAKLTALEVSGDVKIISAPKIVTLDNKKAMIRQGLEVGYYNAEKTEDTGRSVEFKKVDLLLEVTPHVTPDSRVSMSIFITKNDVDSYYESIPSIASNEAQTELLVNDGDTIVIGGIMKSTKSVGETGFPGLSQIPGLGRLFKMDSKSNKNNELLIFITPRIVQLEQRDM